MSVETLPMLTDGRSLGFAHDYLLVMRGAERTFAAIADCQPDAPVYTLLYDEDGTRGRFGSHPVRSSYLQRLPVSQDNFRSLLPLYPRAVASLPVHEHDVIVSSSSAFAHGVPAREDAVHVCFCHTPFRYAWFEQKRALAEVPPPFRPVLRRTLARVRARDREVSARNIFYLANSELCRDRIREFWGEDAPILHPPVDVDRFHVGEPEDYFLIVTELVRHKQVHVALEAARRAGRRAVVVGTGPELECLKAEFGGGTADFRGRASDDELVDLMAGAQALIVPNIEEFGIAAVEAQAAGRPVVGADGGGVRETVVEGVTGTFVPFDDVDALADTLAHHDFSQYDPAAIRSHAERFSTAAFQRGLIRHVRAAQGLSVTQDHRVETWAA